MDSNQRMRESKSRALTNLATPLLFGGNFRLHGSLTKTRPDGFSYHHSALRDLARSEELESPAYKFVACCSIQLSYDRIILAG